MPGWQGAVSVATLYQIPGRFRPGARVKESVQRKRPQANLEAV
jgi:hypothetical protein